MCHREIFDYKPLVIFVVLSLAPFLVAAQSSTGNCAQLATEIKYREVAEYKQACEAIEKVSELFKSYGFFAEPQFIDIEFVPEIRIEGEPVGNTFGAFHRKNQKIFILQRESLKHSGPLEFFGVPVRHSGDEDLVSHVQHSVLLHEVAHLYADTQEMSYGQLNHDVGADEYVAYSAQFMLTDPLLRQLILVQYPLEPFDTEEGYNAYVLAFDTNKFGVRAYLHFLSLHRETLCHNPQAECAVDQSSAIDIWSRIFKNQLRPSEIDE